MKTFKEPVFYQPAKDGRVHQIVDLAKPNANGVLVGRYSGETLEALAVRYPLVTIGELDEIAAEIESLQKTVPVEISEERYNEMRDVLPPEDWQGTKLGSSFKLCERLSGRITTIFVCVGKRYFSFNDLYNLPHATIMTKVMTAKAEIDSKVPA